MKAGRAAWSAAAVAGVLLLALAAGEWSGWRVLRGPLQDALGRAAAVPVHTDGRFRARLLWRPRLEIGHIQVGAGGGLDAPHLLDGRDVAIEWHWDDLWRWRRGDTLRVRALQAGTLDMRLLRAADGRATWRLGAQRAKERDETGVRGDLPRIGLLVVKEGHILVDDRITDTQLQIALQGREAAAAGSGHRASISGRYRALPLDLQLQSGSALPLLRDDDNDSGKERDAEQPASSTLLVKGEVGAARVEFDGRAAALLGARTFDGALRFAGPSLAQVAAPLGITLPQTPAFSLEGRLAHDAGVWRLQAERAVIGASRLAGDFRYDTRSQPPRLSGRLNGSRLLLADLGPAVGAETGGTQTRPPPRAPRQGARVLPQRRFNVPALRAMDADVQVAIDELEFGTDAMAPMRGLRTHVRLERGVLALQQLNADVAGGHASGTTTLDSNAPVPKWSTRLRFGGVDIAGWVRGVRTSEGERKQAGTGNARQLRQQRSEARAQRDTAPPAYVTGVLDADIDVSGGGRSSAEILASLDGRIDVALREGTLSHLVTEALGLDLAQALGVVVRGDRSLPLRCARVAFVSNDGVLKVQRGVMDNVDSTIRIGGTIDLRNETLGLVARARPKDVSPLSLRAPVTVTGSLGAPQFGIEGKRLTGRVLGAAALGSVFAPLALIPLFDAGEGKDAPDPCLHTAEAPAAAGSTTTR